MTYRYLVIDLDDTLLKTDTLYDLWLQLLRNRPLLALLAFAKLLNGRAAFKNFIASHVSLNINSLPYRQSVIKLCEEHRQLSQGHKVILASAADESILTGVSAHLKLFDGFIGSKKDDNLKGKRKLQAIQQMIGDEPFAYAGDSRSDLHIWRGSSKAFVFNPTSSVTRELKRGTIPFEVIEDRKSMLRMVWKQIRPHQWVKNLLLFTPMIGAHQILNGELWWRSIFAFVAFSFMASAVYVLNDLLDVETDRLHPSKRHRPFASGDLPVKFGIVLFPLLFLGAIGIGVTLSSYFLILLMTYFSLNVLYTFKLKEQAIIDVVLLGGFYTLRIIGGGYATDVFVSTWLLSFSGFFFFGLALVKRLTEVKKLEGQTAKASRRAYRVEDASFIQTLGMGSSLLSLVVMALYFNSPDVSQLYREPRRLALLLPLLLFWTARVWFLAHRKELDDDPVLFAVKDGTSWVVALMFALILYSSI